MKTSLFVYRELIIISIKRVTSTLKLNFSSFFFKSSLSSSVKSSFESSFFSSFGASFTASSHEIIENRERYMKNNAKILICFMSIIKLNDLDI